ncbi:hypothetical protein BN1723_004003 [Verticillium longisporum]|uniref:Uncharacterized protein n=1 Tax=Verticillium longisporum TaxID=100787 RepID=A0A0G4MJ84_VERLO|nr:hypothetical protein BN1723_004003 [Verticillium longisporum]
MPGSLNLSSIHLSISGWDCLVRRRGLSVADRVIVVGQPPTAGGEAAALAGTEDDKSCLAAGEGID